MHRLRCYYTLPDQQVALISVCIAAANWVQPEKRERKQRVDYNQNRYFNNAMGIQPGR